MAVLRPGSSERSLGECSTCGTSRDGDFILGISGAWKKLHTAPGIIVGQDTGNKLSGPHFSYLWRCLQRQLGHSKAVRPYKAKRMMEINVDILERPSAFKEESTNDAKTTRSVDYSPT